MPTFNFNKIIKILILSDFVIYSAGGLLAPIFAVFLLDSIEGGDARVAGIAAGIYWIVKSILQIPFGKFLDRTSGEKDDYWFMILGIFIASLVPLGYLVVYEPWHVYALQSVLAIGMAMVIPPWGGIFTRHIDRGREAETWGFESSLLGMGMGVAGIVGGIIAKSFGFNFIFATVSAFGLLGVFLLLLIRNDILPAVKNKEARLKRQAHRMKH